MNSEVAWSAFLREPSVVEPLLQKGDVVLKRRDSEPLRLSRIDREDSTREVLTTAARLIAGVLAHNPDVEADAEAQVPWTRFLPDDERQAFVTEFIQQFEACADLGDFSPMTRLLAAWKSTAMAHAEGLAPALKQPIANIGKRVPRPNR